MYHDIMYLPEINLTQDLRQFLPLHKINIAYTGCNTQYRLKLFAHVLFGVILVSPVKAPQIFLGNRSRI